MATQLVKVTHGFEPSKPPFMAYLVLPEEAITYK